MITVVIPAFNEEPNIQHAAATIADIMRDAAVPYELLFVDDGSKDGTWEEILAAKKKDPRVRGVRFSRNFGKEAAIMAGLTEAKGDACVVMDADLQHPPETIVEMVRLWEDGYEIVEGVKRSRGKESGSHGFAAHMFYKIMSMSAGFDMENASDFKLLDRKAVNALINIPEKNAFFRAMSTWVGFKTTTVKYDVRERQTGESKWSTGALIYYALTNITSYSTLPMQIVTWLGAALFVVGVILSVTTLVQKIRGVALGGFTTVIILLCFASSIIMISLGIIGFYIAKIYDEVKGRPRFIIAESTE